jgi:predicted amidophosphoribosyltransferase
VTPHSCIGCSKPVHENYDLCSGCSAVFSEWLDDAVAGVVEEAEEFLRLGA